VPFAVAPNAAEQTLHGPGLPAAALLHAVLQQKPSTQLPLAQSRHPATLQSAPAFWLHEVPCPFCATQVPPELQ
jgi:hypothetical protein